MPDGIRHHLTSIQHRNGPLISPLSQTLTTKSGLGVRTAPYDVGISSSETPPNTRMLDVLAVEMIDVKTFIKSQKANKYGTVLLGGASTPLELQVSPHSDAENID